MKDRLLNHRQIWDLQHMQGYKGYMNFNKTRLKWVLSLLPEGFLTKESIVLEIGCGSGKWMKAVSPLVGEMYGVDISPEAIKIAAKNLEGCGNITLSFNDGETLNVYDDNTIDLVYSFWTFQHIPRETTLSYLREIRRVLKKDGLLLFQVESYYDPEKNMGDVDYLHENETEQIGYSLKDLLDAVTDSGLTLIHIALEDFRKAKRLYLWSLCKRSGS